ncbi:alpha-L-arabinofuranosidase C-terminal domain-containing protein [Jiangella asiatica]|uniref:non-reducing end alpha-L-arabinofuranosidase n=1 Tax=Jiangella asiatica TaxID=2530372 RepID=A0A4R5CS50_9ACTN|nr:alpha-L-arabinofuranosidase C-terminal domain-containing protein [Jiangella asiatica]TDE03399.1 hypothetical protein E1269_20385 [Jiangella asiatica]
MTQAQAAASATQPDPAASPGPADVHRLLGYRRTRAGESVLTLDADTTGPPVPAEVLGNFFEHMSYATLGGVCAELLLNPAFAREHHLSEEQRAELAANGRALVALHESGGDPAAVAEHWVSSPLASGFGIAILDDESAGGMPLGWSRVGPQAAVGAAVGRLGGAVRVSGQRVDRRPDTVAVDGLPAGIRQGVFLPVHRCLDYDVAASLRTRGRERAAGVVEAAVRRRLPGPDGAHRVGELLASARMRVDAPGWQRVSCRLTVPAGSVALGEPVDFVLRWLPDTHPPASLLVDRVSLLPADHVDGFDPDVVELMRRSTIPQLRWPGGNFVSFHHWRDAVGPVEDRPVYANHAWGGLEHHLIGTDEYLRLAELAGFTPHITVNSGTGTPEEAAAWVEYCNGPVTTPMGALRAANGHPEPYEVRVWEVGNENFGSWQGGYVGATENAARFARFAAAMRAASPVPITLLACGNWFDFADLDERYDHLHADHEWHDELLRLAAEQLDLISLHCLPANDRLLEQLSDAEAHEALIAQVVTAERRFVPDLLARCDAARVGTEGAPIGIAVTEWGVLGLHPNRQMVENFGAVVYGGTFLNFVMRSGDRIPMASPNGFMHGGAIKKAGGRVYTDPQFDLIQHYADFAGAVPLRCALTGPGFDVHQPADLGAPEADVPYVDALAVRSPGGRLALAVVNRHLSEALELWIELGDLAAGAAAARVSTLAHPEITARATPADPAPFSLAERDEPIDDDRLRLVLPPFSTTWVRLP